MQQKSLNGRRMASRTPPYLERLQRQTGSPVKEFSQEGLKEDFRWGKKGSLDFRR